MANINMKLWQDEILTNNKKASMPIVTYPGLQLSGKNVFDLVTNGEEQAKCIEILASRFQSSAGVMVMDLSVEAEAFGSRIAFSDDDIPTVSERLVYDASSINALLVPKVGHARTGEFIKAAAIASKRVTYKPIFGGIIGPYSLAGRLFDITEIMTYILTEPEAAHLLLSKVTDFLIEYAIEYKKAGTSGLVIAEPAAGLLPAEFCHEFSSFYVKKIVDAVQDDNFLIILHNCGNTVTLVQAMLQTGAQGLHFGNAVNLAEILPQIPQNVLAFGNIDPAGIFKMSSAQTVFSKTTELLNSFGHYKNFIPSSGCDVPPGTPLKNVEAFYSAISEYNLLTTSKLNKNVCN